MTTSRSQHLLPASTILLLAAAVAWLSYTQEPAAAYLFPRLIAAVMLVLAIWNFARAVLGLAKTGSGFDAFTLRNIIPGIIIAGILMFWAAKALGFYGASTIAFLAAYSLYDPAPHSSLKSWVKRLAVTAAFMPVMYGLFALLLRVQTPRGLWL